MPRRRASREVPEDLSSTILASDREANTTTRLAEPPGMDALIQALRAVGLSARDTFKAPSFSGEGELFLSQFEDVARANGWSEDQQTLHLRAQLQGPAQGCGRGQNKAEIIEDLRARFGMTCRQAKDRLAMLRRGPRQSLHDLCTEIVRLVDLGFPSLPRADQDSLVLDNFLRAVGNRALQRHMLAIKPATPREAVIAAEEFFTIPGPEGTGNSRAMPIDMDEEAMPIRERRLEQGLASMAKLLHDQSILMGKMLARLEGQSNHSEVSRDAKRLRCFECGGPHFKRDCPGASRQGTSGSSTSQGAGQNYQRSTPGNAKGPAQV